MMRPLGRALPVDGNQTADGFANNLAQKLRKVLIFSVFR
jgi:hypothetical protein